MNPLGLKQTISWLDPERVDYYAAQGNAFRVFVKKEFKEEMKSWNILRLQEFPDLAYVASGGFSKPQFYPVAFFPVVRALHKLLTPWPRLFATRLLVVLEKPYSERTS